MNIREMHIELDIAAQSINSKLLNSFGDEEKDWVINGATLQFVKNRISDKSNPKKEGFEDTTKRYDDLKELKRTISLTAYSSSLTPDNITTYLPSDYMTHIKSRSTTLYNCANIPAIGINNSTLYIKSCTFPNPTGITMFQPIIVTVVVGATSYVCNIAADVTTAIYTQLTDADYKFYVINTILEKLNRISNNNYQVYWERFGSLYIKEGFILVVPTTPTPATVTINVTSSTASHWTAPLIPTTASNDRAYYIYNTGSTSGLIKTVPNRLYSTEIIHDINQHSFGKTKYDSPTTTLDLNNLLAYHNREFYITNIILDYIKKPIQVSLLNNVSCELNAATHDEIIAIAVQKMKAYVNAANYNNILKENVMIE